ncbi:complement regulator-acquiring protein [Borreliella garinii]|uniref:complement regulator-acquiring protein n=1 Tax=Borreliella garinii TaxID=29519 RepID=UPI00292FA447|nr:complement regulator-acquiring protein [Borreliella garinii]WNZ74155.1 complement regulator-acquiring protein [Borreliella garinii]WNZ75122.1 complement regulator-acquiring protein [Borreliella garinii]
MERSTIYKILTLFKIALLSCSLHSKSNNEEARTNELQSNLIAKNFGINKAVNFNKLQQSQLSKTEKKRIIEEFIQRLNENEKLIELIELNIEISAQKTNQDIQKKFEKLMQNKNAWIKIVEEIINKYGDNRESFSIDRI